MDNSDQGFKLVLKTVDTTNIILLDSRAELDRSKMKRRQNNAEESKSKRKKLQTKEDENFQRNLNKKQQLEIHQFDARKTRSRDKDKNKTNEPIPTEEGKNRDKNSSKENDELSNQEIKNKLCEIEKLLKEKLKPQPPQIFLVSTDARCNGEIKKRLENSKTDYDTIILDDDDDEPRKIQIKEEIKVDLTITKEESPEKKKPIMLRKFRPPVCKRRRASTPEVEPEPIANNDSVSTVENEADTSLISRTSSNLSNQSFNKDFAKLSHINAWFAKTQNSWCFKAKNVLARMVLKSGLISTYKCMATSCSYSTVDEGNFKTHLTCHQKQKDADNFLFFCPYCFYKADSDKPNAELSDPVSKLLNHYKAYHSHDVAQCGLCFYRSGEAQSVWEHLDDCHPRDQKLIFETPLRKRVWNEEVENRFKRLMRKNVTPLRCSFCQADYFTCESYENHLNHHLSDSKAKKSAKKDFLIYSTKKSQHEIGLYQCLFCNHGSSNRRELRKHLQNHPKELYYVCKRDKNNPNDDPRSVESLIILKLSQRSDIIVNSFDENDLENLKNTENVRKINK